jgi:hypothetical protein
MRYLILAVISLFIGITQMGCSNRNKTVVGGPDAVEAATRMEESQQEYNDCVSVRHPGSANCDSLQRLYEKDKAEYEAQIQ